LTWTDILTAIDGSPVGAFVREDGNVFAWIESLHVLAVVTVVGTISIVDLRLLGYRAHRRSARLLILDLLPFTWAAFALAALTGGLLFSSNALVYASNGPFIAKLSLLALAGINMAYFHVTAYRRIGEWDDAHPTPAAVQFSGAMSLGLWIAIVFLGRWIGFSI
jgi:hypothetical protein